MKTRIGTNNLMPEISISDALYKKLNLLAEAQEISIEELIEYQISSTAKPVIDGSMLPLTLIADAVVILNDEQKIISFNPGAERLFDYHATDVIGKNLDSLLPENLRALHHQNVRDFMAGEVDKHSMTDRKALQALRKDGSQFPADISLSKYEIDGQQFVTAIIRDVTRFSKNEALLRLMTDNATDLICLHHPDGIYEYVSDSTKFVVGYDPAELVGKNPYDFIHPDDIERIAAHHQTTLKGEQTLRITYRFLTKNESYIWLETLTKPILDENDKVTHLVTVSRDVSEMKQAQTELQQERDFIAKILELSPSAVTMVSKDGQITLANKRAGEVLGIHKEDITSRTYDAPAWKHTDYDGNPWADEKQPFVQVMQTKKPVWDIRHAIEKPDGERIYLAINGMPVFDEEGEISQIIFTVEDFTERKHQQDELEATLKREKKLNKMKSNFLSIVSHEFRTPLSIILSSSGLMRMKYDDISREEYSERLERIEQQVKRLNDLISDVTFINRSVMVGHLIKPSTVNLKDLLDDVIKDLKSNYANVEQIIVKHAGQTNSIVSDIQLLRFIVMNLISNAMKYSGENGQVEIQYVVDNTGLRLLVNDNGIGIPQEDQRKLFEIFHRARNVGNIKGTGLGLSIAKSCIDTLGGEISFESTENEGTTFVVTLPRIDDLTSEDT